MALEAARYSKRVDEDTYRNYKERLNKVLGHTNAVVEKPRHGLRRIKKIGKPVRNVM